MRMCERCQAREGRKWDGTGGFSSLCGPCKLRVTSEQPGFKERIESHIREAVQAIESLETTKDKDTNGPE